jgi:hypothetical protein
MGRWEDGKIRGGDHDCTTALFLCNGTRKLKLTAINEAKAPQFSAPASQSNAGEIRDYLLSGRPRRAAPTACMNIRIPVGAALCGRPHSNTINPNTGAVIDSIVWKFPVWPPSFEHNLSNTGAVIREISTLLFGNSPLNF